MANLTDFVLGLDRELIHVVGTTIFFVAQLIHHLHSYAVRSDAIDHAWSFAKRLWRFAAVLFNGCLTVFHYSWRFVKECWSYTCTFIDLCARVLRTLWSLLKTCWRFASIIVTSVARAVDSLWSWLMRFWRLASFLTTIATALLAMLNINGHSTNSNTRESALTCNTSIPICCPNTAWSLSPELGVLSALEDDIVHLDGMAPSLDTASRAFVTDTIKFLATRDNVRIRLDKFELDVPWEWSPTPDQVHHTSRDMDHLQRSEAIMTTSLEAIAERVDECQTDLARLEGPEGTTAHLLTEIEPLQRAMSLEIARRMVGHVRVATVAFPSLKFPISELTIEDLENASELLDSIKSNVLALRQSYGQDPCLAKVLSDDR